MEEWFVSLTVLEKLFAICVFLGGVSFLIRIVIMFVGSGTDAGAEVDGGADLHVGDGDFGHDGQDSDLSFKILSFQGLSAFFLMFGLVGLSMSRDSGYSTSLALFAAVIAGLGSSWLIGKLFEVFNKLQHTGTVNLNNAIGQEGTVYLSISHDAPGKVRLVVQGRLKVMDAMSDSNSPIPTDAHVKVVGLVNQNTLVVKKL